MLSVVAFADQVYLSPPHPKSNVTQVDLLPIREAPRHSGSAQNMPSPSGFKLQLEKQTQRSSDHRIWPSTPWLCVFPISFLRGNCRLAALLRFNVEDYCSLGFSWHTQLSCLRRVYRSTKCKYPQTGCNASAALLYLPPYIMPGIQKYFLNGGASCWGYIL